MGKVTIRHGRISDKHQVLKLWQEMVDYHITISSIDLEMVENAPMLFTKFFETNVRSKNKSAFVAEEDGKIVGYILGEIQKRPPVFKITHQAFITDMAVTKNLRNKGIGTKLMKVFNVWAKDRGMKYIELNVAVENQLGINFWEKQGFKTIILHQRKLS